MPRRDDSEAILKFDEDTVLLSAHQDATSLPLPVDPAHRVWEPEPDVIEGLKKPLPFILQPRDMLGQDWREISCPATTKLQGSFEPGQLPVESALAAPGPPGCEARILGIMLSGNICEGNRLGCFEELPHETRGPLRPRDLLGCPEGLRLPAACADTSSVENATLRARICHRWAHSGGGNRRARSGFPDCRNPAWQFSACVTLRISIIKHSVDLRNRRGKLPSVVPGLARVGTPRQNISAGEPLLGL